MSLIENGSRSLREKLYSETNKRFAKSKLGSAVMGFATLYGGGATLHAIDTIPQGTFTTAPGEALLAAGVVAVIGLNKRKKA